MSKYAIATFIACWIEGFICYLIGYMVGITHAKRTNTHECVKYTHDKTEPTISKMEQVDEPKTDCNGCKFVGTYDTEFPCANCSRKTKDYYAKDEPQTETQTETQNSNLTFEKADEPQYDFGEYADRLWKIAYERGKREALEQTEPQTERRK